MVVCRGPNLSYTAHALAKIFRPPETHRVYDVCVIGSQLGGAVAGAMLARHGYRVLQIDHEGTGPVYEDGGYLLPFAPTLFPSLRAVPAAHTVLTDLGLATDAARLQEPLSPDLQILLPRNRIDMHRDAAQRESELRREWPAESERLLAALARAKVFFDASSAFMKMQPPLPPDGFGERRTVSKAMRQAMSAFPSLEAGIGEESPLAGIAGHPLATAFDAFCRFLTYVSGEPAPFGMARLVGAVLQGMYRLPGGIGALREACRKKIAESRGELLGDNEPVAVQSLDVSGGRIVSVRIVGSPDAHVARAFVAATDGPTLLRLLPSSERNGKLSRSLERIRVKQQLLTLNLVVKEDALPPGLGETVLALHDSRTADALGNAILIQVLPVRRGTTRGPGEVVPGERLLSVGAFVSAEAWDKGDAQILDLVARMRAALAETVPFFERHLITQSVPALAQERAGGLRPMIHPLYDPGPDSVLGVTGLPAQAPYKNLFFASREVVPGLGLEGEFHAGFQAANLVEGLLGKKELLK
jgi:phytoene dehydrogenase-like protein